MVRIGMVEAGGAFICFSPTPFGKKIQIDKDFFLERLKKPPTIAYSSSNPCIPRGG